MQRIFLTAKFSKYFTTSSYSTYLHEEGSFLPAILLRLKYCKLGTKIFFFMTFFHQLILQEGIFETAVSVILYFLHALYSTISTNLFLALGITRKQYCKVVKKSLDKERAFTTHKS